MQTFDGIKATVAFARPFNYERCNFINLYFSSSCLFTYDLVFHDDDEVDDVDIDGCCCDAIVMMMMLC